MTKKDRIRALVRSFVETVLVKGQPDRLPEFVNKNSFIKHNPHLTDGIAALRDALQETKTGQKLITYQRIHRVLAEGSFILCVSEGEFDGVHSAFYDLFRAANGKLVEHWDTTETVAPEVGGKTTTASFKV